MKNRQVKLVNEFINNNGNMLVEMARINDKRTFPCDVIVYGGNSYGRGRNEHGEPHFVYKKDGEFGCKIAIPTPAELNAGNLKVIDGTAPSSKKMKDLLTWINSPYFKDTTMSNYKFICLMWNALNTDNNNVKQVELPSL